MTTAPHDDAALPGLLDHAAQAVGAPDLIRLRPGLLALRFEVMKVQSARGAVRQLVAEGRIARGDTVVDSSSGVYALALALACHEAGLQCVVVGSTTVDETLRLQLGMLGARLEQMPPSDSLRADQDRRVARIRDLLAQHPDWHWMRQYHDAVHYRGYRDLALGLGRRLLREGHRAVELVAPVGSGSSSGALALGLAESGLEVRLTGVQPFGSVTFGSEDVQDPDMLIAGIGSCIEFRNVRRELYREIHWVSAEVGRAGAVSLCRDHALFAGLSSGAAYAVAGHVLGRAPHGHAHQPAPEAPSAPGAGQDGDTSSGRCVLMVCPDTGHRYAGPVFRGHEDVPPVTDFTPHRLTARGQTPRLPWSCVDWGGTVRWPHRGTQGLR
ncbi:pyridoxal-phosphate dependent enzyme [Kocuria sp.]|uniref:pyridoxal-phosphate dependent enzyme n=1 Tax=Kocuria sp. TaxID=1871328 RepID=UPI0026DB6E19|nr:pyridoxal-phosphate dependent enzyme [Kocuria sp.]MDO4919593.1 pyridoxal-phosphate dependent enzyme [Kocuria sp.]